MVATVVAFAVVAAGVASVVLLVRRWGWRRALVVVLQIVAVALVVALINRLA